MPERRETRPGAKYGERILAATAAFLILAGPTLGADDPPRFGRSASNAELADSATHIFADGRGLPPGGGDAGRGKPLYESLCAGCHGDVGQGGSAMELVGDRALLASEFPDRGIAVYWPYAPALFEYIQRAMPPDKPYSLDAEEVYAILAHLLELNGLVEPGTRVDAALLSALPMPNRDNFRSAYGRTVP